MGLYLKNVSMPGCCAGCFKMGIANVVHCEVGNSEDFTNVIPENCLIYEINCPHGDLVDKNMLKADLSDESWSNPYFSTTSESVVQNVIKRQKVVLGKED